MRVTRRSVAMAIVLWMTAPVTADPASSGWTRFRGPNGEGRAAAPGLPASIDEPSIRWKVDLGGDGHSSPVLWGGKLFVTTADRATASQTLLCIDTDTGRAIWKKTYASAPYRQHTFNSYASASCAVDEARVYMVVTSDRERQLVALTHEGQERWRYPLGAYRAQHGSGASPIVYRDMVVIASEHAEAGFLVAVDRESGEQRWRIAREGLEAAYATPCVMAHAAGEWLVFASQAHGVTAVDPATGRIAWELGGIFPQRVVASPMIAGGKVIVSCGQGGAGVLIAAVAPPDAGNDKPRLAWTIDRSAPYVPTSVEHAGKLFALHDGGIAMCIDPSDGKVIWRERLGGAYFASPIAVNDLIYAVSRDGKVVSYRADGRFEVVGRGDLGEESYATPAVAHGRLYFRTTRHVLCVGGPDAAAAK